MIEYGKFILLSSSGPGPGQVLVRSRSERSEIDLSLTIFLVFTHNPPHKLYFGFRGVYTCQMDLGWVGMTQVGS